MRALVLITALAIAAPTSHAEPTAPKRRSTALLLSLGTTLGGYGLTVVGGVTEHRSLEYVGGGLQLLGPTAGHWYAGEDVTPALLARLAGVGLVAVSFPKLVCLDTCGDTHAAWAGMIGGTALMLGGTIWDIASAPSAADDWNRAHGVTLTPTALRTPGGRLAPGLAVGGAF